MSTATVEKTTSRQQTQETEKKKRKKRGGPWLWILLIIIIFLLLLTTVVLGSRLYDLATRDKLTVDLGMAEPTGEIELFRIEYANEHDQITVRGVNADNVVAPGTTVNYELRLRNNDEVVIDFVMCPAVEFLTNDWVPVEFKVIDEYGNYVVGDEDEWASAGDMNELEHFGEVHPGEVYTYHISWHWAFERGENEDEYDTYLGNLGGEVAPGVRVGIVTESSASAVEPITTSHMMHLLGEGFGCCWCCYLVWILLIICLVLLIIIWRQRRKLNRQGETMDEYEEVLTRHGLMINGELIAEYEEALK